jgi:hypothetical protein
MLNNRIIKNHIMIKNVYSENVKYKEIWKSTEAI